MFVSYLLYLCILPMVAGNSTVYVLAECVRQANAQELLLLWGSRGLELESIGCEATVLPKMSEC